MKDNTITIEANQSSKKVKSSMNATNLLDKVKKGLNHVKRNYQLHLIIMIPVIYMLIFHYYPMYGVQIAFKKFVATKGISGSEWVGLVHFVRFFESPIFKMVIKNTLEISIFQLVAGFPIPIFLALTLNNTRNKRFKKTVQMVTYAPYFISTVVMVGIINQFFSPKYGIVNSILQALGFDPIMFTGIPAYFADMFVWTGVWQRAGWGAIIYLSALAAVDLSLHEAAKVDGANRFKRMIHIDIPCIMPTMITLLILNFGRMMSVGFEKALLMQNPTNLARSEIIATYVYKVGMASSIPNYSYAAAIGLFNSLINFALIILVNRISKKLTETSLW